MIVIIFRTPKFGFNKTVLQLILQDAQDILAARDLVAWWWLKLACLLPWSELLQFLFVRLPRRPEVLMPNWRIRLSKCIKKQDRYLEDTVIKAGME